MKHLHTVLANGICKMQLYDRSFSNTNIVLRKATHAFYFFFDVLRLYELCTEQLPVAIFQAVRMTREVDLEFVLTRGSLLFV